MGEKLMTVAVRFSASSQGTMRGGRENRIPGLFQKGGGRSVDFKANASIFRLEQAVSSTKFLAKKIFSKNN